MEVLSNQGLLISPNVAFPPITGQLDDSSKDSSEDSSPQSSDTSSAASSTTNTGTSLTHSSSSADKRLKETKWSKSEFITGCMIQTFEFMWIRWKPTKTTPASKSNLHHQSAESIPKFTDKTTNSIKISFKTEQWRIGNHETRGTPTDFAFETEPR